MGRGPDKGRGLPRDLARLAVFGLALLALVSLPLAAADPAPAPLVDTEGPVITTGAIAPAPVVPDFVTVTASATDNESFLASAEFFVDMPGIAGSSFFRMRPMDNVWNAATEDLVWLGTYDMFRSGQSYGPHLLYVHAMDALGNWGPYETFPYFLGDPAVIGPGVASLAVTPSDLAQGAPLTIEAAITDPFKGAVESAEFFLDLPGPDGTGTEMYPADGGWGQPGEVVNWTGVVTLPLGDPLPLGDHMLYVHGKARGEWGAAMGAPFVALAPALTLQISSDSETAAPGSIVTYSITFENRGNANATSASLDVSLAATVSYLDDTVSTANGTRLGGTSYSFTDVAREERAFMIRAQVLAGATDGLPFDAHASLDFTNDQAWDFPAVSASTAGTVVAPEVTVTVSGPSAAFASESATLTIRIEHTGVRTIPVLDVALAPSPWTTILFDTAAAEGGASLAPGLWRFANLEPRTFSFDVAESILATASDGLSVPRAVEVSYTSRLGTPVHLTDALTFAVSRPSFDLTVVAEPSSIPLGDQSTLTLTFSNLGSAPAAFVQIEVVLPSALLLVGGDPPTLSAGSHHTWLRTEVGAGPHPLSLIVESRGQGSITLSFDLTYTSPDGNALGRVVAPATILVQVPPPSPTSIYVGASAAGAAIALSAALATERGKTAFLFLFLPLYTRLQKEHILDHETRGMIRGYILANPGDHYNSIKEALELPNGTLAYHIQVLEKEMLVRSVKDGKFRRFYPFEMRMPEGGEPTKIQRVVLDLIHTNPGITPRDAASLLGLTPSTVSYHLERLEELGRIEYRREGISKRLFVKGDLAA